MGPYSREGLNREEGAKSRIYGECQTFSKKSILCREMPSYKILTVANSSTPIYVSGKNSKFHKHDGFERTINCQLACTHFNRNRSKVIASDGGVHDPIQLKEV